jgi:MFS family permease
VPALRHRNYRLFFAGQLVSVTGTWMEALAQSWLVLSLTSSAFYLGLVPVAQFLPAVLFGLYGGVIADRYPKRRILVITQACAASISLILSALIFAGYIQLWEVFLSAALLGVVNSIDTPTRQAFVSEMVPRDDLVQAVSLNSAVFNAGRLVGPAIAGVVLAAVGPAWCFLVNGLSFFAVILQLLRMDESKLFTLKMRRASNSIREGISYAIHDSTIMRTILVIGFISTFAMNFNVWIPLLAKDTFDIGAGGFGLLMSMLGLGSMSGALFLAFMGRRRPSPSIIVLTAAALAVTLILLGLVGSLSAPVLIAILLLPIAGFAMTFTASMANSTIQMEAPDHMRGRVMAFYFMVFNSGMPIGALFAGVTSHAFGVSTSIIIGAIIGLVATLIIGYFTLISRPQPVKPEPTRATGSSAD